MNIKKGLKKTAIFLLSLGAVSILVITLTNLAGDNFLKRKAHLLIVDSDTGRNVSGLLAITRLLIDKDIEISGLLSVHHEFSDPGSDSTCAVNQLLNEQLLKTFNRENVPHPKGAVTRILVQDSPKPQKSPAANFIIEKAKTLRKKQKLEVVCLGSPTNIASALILEPSIADKLIVYLLAMHYDPRYKIWNKNETNSRNDLDALDFLLNFEHLDITIMPLSVAENLSIRKDELMKHIGPQLPEFKFIDKFKDQRTEERISTPDLALIQALIDPEMVKMEKTLTPPENTQRSVNVYTAINQKLMEADFIARIIDFRGQEARGK